MSKDSSIVEHIWAPAEALPNKLIVDFPFGACTVWIDEEFTAAFPATSEQADHLADLMEEAAATNDMTEYFAERDRLCGPRSFLLLTAHFKEEMQHTWAREEAIPGSKYTAPSICSEEQLSEAIQNKLVIRTLARGATAELREVLKEADRDTARPIYDELLRLAYEVANKHSFGLARQKPMSVAVVTFK